MSEVSTEQCLHWKEEVAFIASINPSFLRDAWLNAMGGLNPEYNLLEMLLKPLEGQLWWHLTRHPQKCKYQMIKLLEERLDQFRNCHYWRKLLEIAVTPGMERSDSHLKDCVFCQRDLRQMKPKLPYYKEFYKR